MSNRGPADDGSYLFYVTEGGGPRFELPDPELRSALWRPTWRQIRPTGLSGRVWPVWWAMHHLRVFSNRDFSIFLIKEDTGRIIHRAGVFPRYPRFPFMGPDDLQIGDVWTEAGWRGRGLATFSVCAVRVALARPARLFWYVTERDNTASRRVVEKIGFRCVGEGRRVPRFGARVLGSFVIERDTISPDRPG